MTQKQQFEIAERFLKEGETFESIHAKAGRENDYELQGIAWMMHPGYLPIWRNAMKCGLSLIDSQGNMPLEVDFQGEIPEECPCCGGEMSESSWSLSDMSANIYRGCGTCGLWWDSGDEEWYC